MENNNYTIELIAIDDEEKVSDLGNLLKEEVFGQKIYHICYKTDNITKKVDELVKKGFKVIKPPERAIACDNKEVVFLLDYDLGIVELIEEKE